MGYYFRIGHLQQFGTTLDADFTFTDCPEYQLLEKFRTLFLNPAWLIGTPTDLARLNIKAFVGFFSNDSNQLRSHNQKKHGNSVLAAN